MRRARTGRRGARRGQRRQRGYAYLALLILIAIIGVAAAASAELGAIYQRRIAEKELLFVGDQFQRALLSYATATPLGQPTQPRTLDELLRDPRYPNVVRHLRKIYEDPMTGNADWVLVKSPDGQTIVGIHSASHAHPIQITQFAANFQGFDNKKSYTDWVFVARFPTLTQGQRPPDGTLTNGGSSGAAVDGSGSFGGGQSGAQPNGSPFGGNSFGGNSFGGASPNGSPFNSSPFGGGASGSGLSNSPAAGSSPP
jgi:type II secretory pathway pseudopilin PulG